MEQNKLMSESGLTLGSLFDGSGGFPLGGLLSGIQPVWASEVEPFPIRVTTKRLPFMKHYGDVSKMKGGEVEPVDVITFGSPCQDMSVAGKRAGLDGSRSNLFYEAVRIVKEMRCATDGKYPRWICWENVPGAFSSNKGEDFKAVLDSICKIKDETCDVPECEKWEPAGEILGDDFSVAWRVLDAQFWGVPQRRKRIFLVADFAGRSAGQILFESEGLSGYSAEGFRAWQGTACCAENCADKTGVGYDGYNGSLTEDKAATLGVNCGTSTGRNGVVLNDQGRNRMDITNDMTSTLRAEAHHPPCVMESAGFCTEHSAKARSIGYEEEMSPTLRAGVVPVAVAKAEPEYTVRRLTPTECARLQGFPDWWCADLGTAAPTYGEIAFWTDVFETHRLICGTSSKPKSRKQILAWLKNPYSDAAEYKMWGNGIALPCVYFLLSGIVWSARNESIKTSG